MGFQLTNTADKQIIHRSDISMADREAFRTGENIPARPGEDDKRDSRYARLFFHTTFQQSIQEKVWSSAGKITQGISN